MKMAEATIADGPAMRPNTVIMHTATTIATADRTVKSITATCMADLTMKHRTMKHHTMKHRTTKHLIMKRRITTRHIMMNTDNL
jgi:hypothetical protein